MQNHYIISNLILIIIPPYLGLLFNLFDLLAEFGDVLVEVGTEFVDVGVSLCQRFIYSIPHTGDTGVQRL